MKDQITSDDNPVISCCPICYKAGKIELLYSDETDQEGYATNPFCEKCGPIDMELIFPESGEKNE